MNIIGKFYHPYDNSFCINCFNNKEAWIVQRQEKDSDYYPDKEEIGASFIIVSKPYKETVLSLNEYHDYTFIKVKSSNTGIIYRTLFFESKISNE